MSSLSLLSEKRNRSWTAGVVLAVLLCGLLVTASASPDDDLSEALDHIAQADKAFAAKEEEEAQGHYIKALTRLYNIPQSSQPDLILFHIKHCRQRLAALLEDGDGSAVEYAVQMATSGDADVAPAVKLPQLHLPSAPLRVGQKLSDTENALLDRIIGFLRQVPRTTGSTQLRGDWYIATAEEDHVEITRQSLLIDLESKEITSQLSFRLIPLVAWNVTIEEMIDSPGAWDDIHGAPPWRAPVTPFGPAPELQFLRESWSETSLHIDQAEAAQAADGTSSDAGQAGDSAKDTSTARPEDATASSTLGSSFRQQLQTAREAGTDDPVTLSGRFGKADLTARVEPNGLIRSLALNPDDGTSPRMLVRFDFVSPEEEKAERLAARANDDDLQLPTPATLPQRYVVGRNRPPMQIIRRGSGSTLIRRERVKKRLVGIVMTPNTRGILIQQVLPGSPGAQAGLNAGDVITAIDGVSARNLDFHEAKRRLSIGVFVELDIIKTDGLKSRVIIERQLIEVPR